MNTQHVTLDLSKKFSTKPTVYVGRGDHGGTTIAASFTDAGLPIALDGMDVTLSLPMGDMPCAIDVDAASCTLGEWLVPNGTEDAHYTIIDGDRTYTTQRLRIVTLEGATQ